MGIFSELRINVSSFYINKKELTLLFNQSKEQGINSLLTNADILIYLFLNLLFTTKTDLVKKYIILIL